MVRRYILYILIILLVSLVFRALVVDSGPTATDPVLIELFRPAGRLFLSIFGNPFTGLYLSLAIAFLFLVLAARLLIAHVLPARRALIIAHNRILSVTDKPGEPSVPEQLRSAVTSVPLLADAWQAYARTIVERPEQSGPQFYSLKSPQEFFHLGQFESQNVNLRAFAPLPNYFVGLGLILTFLGLVAGLYFASIGIKTGSPADARGALVNLLNTSTFKFATSVTGLAASLLFSILLRQCIQTLERRFDAFCRRIEELVPPISEAVLLNDLVEQVRQQTTALLDLTGSTPLRPVTGGTGRQAAG